MKRLFLVDLDKCFGCFACEVACKQEKDLPEGPKLIQVVEIGPRRIGGKVYRDFFPTLCCQCGADAQCIQVCPMEALERHPNGIIRIDEAECTGCGLCIGACPYGLLNFNPGTAKPVKCDFCFDLVNKGLDPSCVSHCPANALTLLSKDGLNEFISSRNHQRIGQIVYVSKDWRLSAPAVKPQ